MKEWAADTDITLDYSPTSVCKLFEYAIQKIRNEIKSDIISEAMYDTFRSVWLVRLGYYFGESLIRSGAELRWQLGEFGTAFQNHPVVSGFSNGTEAAVVTIAKNVSFSIISGESSNDRIAETVEHWFGYIDGAKR